MSELFKDKDQDTERILSVLRFLVDEHEFSTPVKQEEWYATYFYYYKHDIGICAEYDFRDGFFGLKIANLSSVGKWHELKHQYLNNDSDGNLMAGYSTNLVLALNLRDLGLEHSNIGEDEIAKTVNRDMYLIKTYMPGILDGSIDIFHDIKKCKKH